MAATSSWARPIRDLILFPTGLRPLPICSGCVVRVDSRSARHTWTLANGGNSRASPYEIALQPPTP